jgi:hypothetical protein
MSYKENGFIVKKNVLHEQTVNLLKLQFKMLEECTYIQHNIDYSNKDYFADPQVNKSFSWYSNNCFESLMLILQKDYENILNKKLFPCYSFARVMYEGAVMKKHKDRPSCQYSVSICIDEDLDNPYPIFIEDYAGKTHSVHLKSGDALFYNGTELNHWREEYQGKEQMQVFLHYVDAEGEFKDCKFDKRLCLGLDKNT